MNTLKTPRQLLESPDNGVVNNTIDGKCSGCGSCCSNVLPISKKEAETIAKYIKKHGIKEQKHVLPTMIVHNDLSCPFRSATEEKPDLSRTYGDLPGFPVRYVSEAHRSE